MPRPTGRRHFTMIREFHLADFVTLANGLCGMSAVLSAMAYLDSGAADRIYLAAALVALALVFDVLDGRVARWRHDASPLGRELDSLADIVSFGVAPAAIAYAAGAQGLVDRVVLVFFVLCGVSRLARYNVTAEDLAGSRGKVEYYEGTPIPTSVVPLAALVLAFATGDLYPVRIAGAELHLVSLLFLLSGCLMISKTLRIPKL